MAQITKDMLISDILAVDPSIAAILMASGMHCVGCPASQGEELQEACAVHGMDVKEVLKDINEYLEKKAAQ
jgi:hybrid cluster-associated redox disulfide protein